LTIELLDERTPMSRVWSITLLLLLIVPPANGREAKQAPAPPAVPVVKVAVRTAPAPPQRALKYALLPDNLDLVPGNAAPQWMRAGAATAEVARKLTSKEYAWASNEVPLDKLPKEDVRRLVEAARATLRLADRAARYDLCDWEFPPLRIQDIDLTLPEVQHFRVLANLLSIRCRLELAEGRFDQAAYTLQTGFALGRHVADAPTLVQNLVGVAITAIMLGRVEEWLGLPGAPDLFWPLTALPEPMVDARHCIARELGILYRSFPRLRGLGNETLTAAQDNQLIGDLLRDLSPLYGDKGPPAWQSRLGLAVVAARVYPEARKYLIAQGRNARQVDAMPSLQAVGVFFLDQYDETTDDILKWMNLPYWQARPGMAEVERRIRASRTEDLNVFIGLLMPAIVKVFETNARTQRQVAALRCAAAVRLHVVRHGGKLPARLGDITELPMPIDPATGKGFDEMYKVNDGKALLEVPPPTKQQPPATGRRFEFVPAAQQQENHP
jgi:hypothetical protein